MTEARWRSLVAVAETGSVRAAAARLVLTESAVSSAVSALAREVGAPLVERSGRGLRLTAAGATYAGYARRLLGLLEEARDAARAEADPATGHLRLSAVTTAADHLLPQLLASFRSRWPDVSVTLEAQASSRVWQQLADHATDLVLAGRPPAGLRSRVLATRPNELVVVASGGLAGDVDPASTPWLLREDGSGTRATVEAYLAGRELAPPTLVLGSNGAVIAGAAAGLGVALVSRDAVEDALERGRLVVVRLPGTPMRRPWHLVSGATPSATARLFVDHVVELDARPRWRRSSDAVSLPSRGPRRGA